MANKIRVHNQGKREYTIPPAPRKKSEKKDGKKRKLQPGRAIEIEEKLALKLMADYPHDLIEFDSLVSGEKRNLNKENARLESENSSYLEKIGKLESENQKLKEDEDSDVQLLKDRIAELENEAADPNLRVDGGFQKKEAEGGSDEVLETETEDDKETGTDHDETTNSQ